MRQTWINLVIGLWVALSGMIGGLQNSANLVVSGLIVATLGFTASKKWQSQTIGALGLWLILSGTINSLIAPANFIIVGLGIAAFALSYVLAKKAEPAEAKLAH